MMLSARSVCPELTAFALTMTPSRVVAGMRSIGRTHVDHGVIGLIHARVVGIPRSAELGCALPVSRFGGIHRRLLAVEGAFILSPALGEGGIRRQQFGIWVRLGVEAITPASMRANAIVSGCETSLAAATTLRLWGARPGQAVA